MSKKATEMFQTLLKKDEIIGTGVFRTSTDKRETLVFPKETTVFDIDLGIWFIGDGITLGGVENGQGDRWDDLRFPFTQTKTGANLKPDFDETNLGLLFPNGDSTEKVFIIAQMAHNWKMGTSIHPHIHWIQTESTTPTWKMDYRWYSNGDVVPSFTTVETSSVEIPYVSGSMLQISSFGTIDSTGITGVSSFFEAKIYRDDTDVTGDVLGKEFDIHYIVDSLGSVEEY